MKIANPWIGVIRLAIVMVALTAILYITASKFDDTEVQTIIYTFCAVAGAESLGGYLQRA